MRQAPNLSAALLMMCAAAAPAAMAATAADIPIVAQELVKVRESSRVQAAIWTRRPDAYTLQLVFHPMALIVGRTRNLVEGPRMAPGSATSAVRLQTTKPSEVSVWLLRADGTQIVTRVPWTNPAPEKCDIRCNAIEVLYRFSIAEGSQAVAAAVRIGDDYYIEKLKPLEPAPE
jgi:hypothetical protein